MSKLDSSICPIVTDTYSCVGCNGWG